MRNAGKKLLLVCLLLASFAVAARAAQTYAYWIAGTVPDVTGATANGRTVDFYKTDTDLTTGRYAQAVITGNTFMINAYNIWPEPLTVGGKYKVATVAGSDGYGATGEVTISGVGWDEVKGMVLVMGGGIATPAPVSTEPAPQIKIWFNNRLYQISLDKNNNPLPFVVSERAKVTAQVAIDDPYTLAQDISTYSIILDKGTSLQQVLSLKEENISKKVFAAGSLAEEGKISALSLEYSLPQPLAEGQHVFAVSARSSGLSGGIASSATSLATVEVLGGPVRLIGTPICFPSPYSITKDGKVTIQYQLSKDADIQIVFASIAAQLVKTLVLEKGAEGGTAGVNKITWDGRTDRGPLAGNGIYLGTIISREDGRKLGSVKLTVFD